VFHDGHVWHPVGSYHFDGYVEVAVGVGCHCLALPGGAIDPDFQRDSFQPWSPLANVQTSKHPGRIQCERREDGTYPELWPYDHEDATI